MEIRFAVRGLKTPEDEQFVIARLAALVSDRPRVVVKETGYRYALDEGNDWWADRDPQTGEFVLAYRYGTKERMDALKVVVDWLVGGN